MQHDDCAERRVVAKLIAKDVLTPENRRLWQAVCRPPRGLVPRQRVAKACLRSEAEHPEQTTVQLQPIRDVEHRAMRRHTSTPVVRDDRGIHRDTSGRYTSSIK